MYFQFDVSSTLFVCVCNVVCAADLIITPFYEVSRFIMGNDISLYRLSIGLLLISFQKM